MPKSKNQEHLTPDIIFDLIFDEWGIFPFAFYDPVPKGTPYKSSIFFNGLYGNWKKYNFVNPPYEIQTLTQFVKKAIQQAQQGKTSIMLLPCKTDQDWFHFRILLNDFQILWIRKRLRFKNNKDGATGSHFLVEIK